MAMTMGLTLDITDWHIGPRVSIIRLCFEMRTGDAVIVVEWTPPVV